MKLISRCSSHSSALGFFGIITKIDVNQFANRNVRVALNSLNCWQHFLMFTSLSTSACYPFLFLNTESA